MKYIILAKLKDLNSETVLIIFYIIIRDFIDFEHSFDINGIICD